MKASSHGQLTWGGITTSTAATSTATTTEKTRRVVARAATEPGEWVCMRRQVIGRWRGKGVPVTKQTGTGRTGRVVVVVRVTSTKMGQRGTGRA